MTGRRIDGFFYGLFMDRDILRHSQVEAAQPRRAYVNGYALVIGNRATLVPAPRARSYGMVFALTHDDMDRLYSGPDLEGYRPEAVIAHTLDGGALPVACEEQPSPAQRANEHLMLALRRDEGLAVDGWERAHGLGWSAAQRAIAAELDRAGRVCFDGRHLRLTAEGMLLADEITARLMLD